MKRLDTYLAESSLAPSRETAKKMIINGFVSVDDVVIFKPSFPVDDDAIVKVENNDICKYVSRGALKLEKALELFGIDVEGMVAADIGASTGGFTDLLLQRGAKCVYAIENGTGQLHPKLLSDSRVISYDNTNARYIEKGFIPLCDIVVMDVSFISQTKLFASVTNILKNNGIFISLIKPQFEAGKQHIKKNGIVKDSSVHDVVIKFVTDEALIYNLHLIDVTTSPITGGDGNKEFLAYFVYKETVR